MEKTGKQKDDTEPPIRRDEEIVLHAFALIGFVLGQVRRACLVHPLLWMIDMTKPANIIS